MDVSSERRRLDKLIAQRSLALLQIKQEKKSIESLTQQVEDTEIAQSYLQQLAQEVQTKAHYQIAKVVSKCLSAVFEDAYQLEIVFERKRGKTDATFVYTRNGHRVEPHQTSGAVREVTSLALRLVALCLKQPPARRLLILDEGFAGLDKENIQRVAALIQSLADEMGVQFVIATHLDALRIGRVIELTSM